jgi:hypothetical protein
LKVSWERMPLGNSRILLSHSRFALPNCSISTQVSAPQITAQMAIIRISCKLCLRVRSIRGSSIRENLSASGRMCSGSIAEPLSRSETLVSRANQAGSPSSFSHHARRWSMPLSDGEVAPTVLDRFPLFMNQTQKVLLSLPII